MAKECIFCKKATTFYVWSTSRNIDRKILSGIKFTSKKGEPICFYCATINGILIDRPLPDLNKPRKRTLWKDMDNRTEPEMW